MNLGIKRMRIKNSQMKIVVFTDQDPTPSDNALISKFESCGYRILVDSVHKHQLEYLVRNFDPCPHRVYYADRMELYDGIVKELDGKAPFSFIAMFNEGQQLNNQDWVYIRLYLKALLYGYKMPRMTRRLTSLLNDGKHVEFKECSEVENGVEKEPCYTFKKSVFEDRNIALGEIVKPIVVKLQDKLLEKEIVETSVPYTVVIRNFASRGWYPLFWSLFVCDSWGKDNKDIAFLKALWGDLKMEGEFDMDLILKNGMDECNALGGCSGPEVYRKALDETLEVLLKKEQGYQ